MDVAFRPDLHPARNAAAAPLQRKQQGEPNEELSSLPSPSGGATLPEDVQAQMEDAFGVDFSAVRIHEGPQAAAVGALAYTQGTDIHFQPGQYNPHSQQGRELLGHELTHVVQQSQGRVRATTQAKGLAVNDDAILEREAHELGMKAARGTLEREADETGARAGSDTSGGSATKVVGHSHRRTPYRAAHLHGGPSLRGNQLATRNAQVIQLHPAEKIFRHSLRWLSRRAYKTVSKHIGRHARRIGGRAIHSVFKQPKKIKSMVEATVKEAIELTAKHARKSATEMLEEGALRVTRQATGTPGKHRWIVQKTFAKPIGTAGERILRIVIDQSGRVVTAFPADRLLSVGLGVGALGVLDSRTATAGEKARAYAASDAENEDSGSWWEIVPIIGDLWGGELNAGEDAELRRERELAADIAAMFEEIEEHELRSLSAEEKEILEEAFRLAVATLLHAEAEETE